MSYVRALEIIEEVFQGKRDAMSCLFTFAKADPIAFTRAIDTPVLAQPEGQWVREAVALLSAGNIVGAIKKTREAHKCGLKEAKDLCDAARERLRLTDPAGAEDLLLAGPGARPQFTPAPVKLEGGQVNLDNPWIDPWIDDVQKQTLGELLRGKLKEAEI